MFIMTRIFFEIHGINKHWDTNDTESSGVGERFSVLAAWIFNFWFMNPEMKR